MEFSGKTAVITGGATGIGFALAKQLGRAGTRVILFEPRENRLQEAVDLLAGEGIDAKYMVGDVSKAEGWTGLRPMTPDGTPVLGPTRYENLFLNTGHGTLGWTMSCGSARLVADLVVGNEPGIDIDGLTAARYGQ